VFGGQILLFGAEVNPILLGLILVAVCLPLGYILGASFSTKGLRLGLPPGKGAQQPPAFLKGMRSMLAKETDQAIAELTRAVELDSETVETYIALGHLYRSKGIFDRAISIRQSIIARPRLDPKIKIQALYDLGGDYRQGGFLSRAIEAFEQVLAGDSRHLGALTELEQIFEEINDWERALDIQKRLDKETGRSSPEVLAQLKTEQAKQLHEAGNLAEAKAALKRALAWNKACVPALLCLGDIYLEQGETKKALGAWRRIAQSAPKLTFLALEMVIGRDWEAKDTEAVDEFILGSAGESKDPWTQFLTARYLAARGKEKETIEALKRVFELSPGFLPAHRDLGQILMDRGQIDEILSAYQDLLEHLPGVERQFQCSHCGFKSGEISWKCPSCRQWETISPLN